jgi:hypothetical protein
MIGTYYEKRYVAALMDLFPELDLQPSEFIFIPSIMPSEINLFVLISNLKGNYWESKKNRVALFQKIALERGFDPLIPENWYHVTDLSLLHRKVLFFPIFIMFCFYFYS